MPCPIHDAEPEAAGWLRWYLTLWMRMKRWGQLPDPGGLLDQEERVMRLLDIIEDEFRDIEARRLEEARRRASGDDRTIRISWRRT